MKASKKVMLLLTISFISTCLYTNKVSAATKDTLVGSASTGIFSIGRMFKTSSQSSLTILLLSTLFLDTINAHASIPDT
ncbi:hypothetical protein ACTPEM_26135, partial [Clostridioides difficile]